MGGKKKGKKGKKGKKKKGAAADDQTTAIEEGWIMQAKIESMQRNLINEQEEADIAKAGENELKAKLLKLEKDYEDEVEATTDIVADMTRQYKSKQDDLCQKIN